MEKYINMMRAKLNKEKFQPSSFFNTLFLLVLVILINGLMPVAAQNSEVVVFSENWNDSYLLEPWKPNNSAGWFLTSPKNQLVAQENRGNSLRVNFDAGDLGSASGMGNYRIYLDSMYKELYISWEYWLTADFDFGYADGNGGGKFFGGVSGGNMYDIPRTAIDTADGWAYFMMFQNGSYYTYPYFYNAEYWGGYPAGYKITALTRGEWREITVRLKVNDPQVANGIVEVFDNGKLVFQQTNAQMTSPTHPEWLIDALYLNNFFGGTSACPKAQYAMYDNLVAWYYPKGSSMYRSGVSESGRTLYAPRVSNYHPKVPNKFTETVYSDAAGKISSHCGFEMPIYHGDDYETSTIEISNASRISINVSEFTYDKGQSYTGYKQILNIYQGKGSNRTLVKSFMYGQNTSVPSQIEISGNTAEIEWQAGNGQHRGFTLTYTSNGTGSGKNFTCGKFTATQRGANQTTTQTEPTAYPPYTPSNLQVTSATTTSIGIKWNDNSAIETAYEIERMGPADQRKTTRVGANITTYNDTGLESNATYTYWVRAYNTTGGYSAYTASVQAKTQSPAVPLNAPSSLTSTGYTEKSITIQWSDNSNNENGFMITRTLGMNPDSSVNIIVGANETGFTDDSLASNTTYIYTVKAVNNNGTSASSNKNVAATLSIIETQRVKEGLIAYYNFGYDPDYIVHDLSGYGNPLNLKILQPSAVAWNENNRIEIISNTAIVSASSASKITSEIKRTGEITMECWIRPSDPDLSASSRVISLAINDAEVGFVLDQHYSDVDDGKSLSYSVRLQTESTNKSGFPEISPLNSIAYLNMQHVVYIRDTLGNESLYVNGEKSAEGFRPSNFSTWSNNFYLRLGNENDLTHPWKGTFYSMAIYNKALSVGEISKNYALGPCDNIKTDGQEFTINVYPNPITDVANIEIVPVNLQDYIPLTTIRLLDMYGKVHYQTTLFNPDDGYHTTMDFGRYSKGIYFLQIVSGNDQSATKLIVQ
jgi:hypothetical protein